MLITICACGLGPIEEAYSPEFPDLPVVWEEILGEPHWRLEWIENGTWVYWEGKEGFPELSLAHEWTSPVLGWPFWPEKALYPGLMYPAGALFPLDVSSGGILLSWEAGVDAFFWQKLVQNEENRKLSATPRFSWFFNWPKFRELMDSDDIPVEVRENPWLADWNEIAKKTVESGFDRRRIKAEIRDEVAVFCPVNLWAASSPFAQPVRIITEEPHILLAKKTPETWVSGSGLIRCFKDAWIFIPWP